MLMQPLWTPFGRRCRNASPKDREKLWTAATGVTIARAIICSAMFLLAIAQESNALALAALGVNMVLDTLDGEVARRREQETIAGAQLDGAIDRLVVVLVIFAAMAFRGDVATALLGLVVCVQFVVVDHLLSTQFLRFGLWSPDHFYAVDERVWRVNWSPVAKLVSNVPILLFAVSPVTAWGALVPAVGLVAVRLLSYGRVRRLARQLVPELRYAVGPRAPDFVQHWAEWSADAVAVERAQAPLRVRQPVASPTAAPAGGDRIGVGEVDQQAEDGGGAPRRQGEKEPAQAAPYGEGDPGGPGSPRWRGDDIDAERDREAVGASGG